MNSAAVLSLEIIGLFLAFAFVPLYLIVFGSGPLFNFLPLGRAGRFTLISIKSLRRNLLRTTLTQLAIFVLVIVIAMVWSALYFLDMLTTEKAKDFKVIVSEKYQALSQMPFSYAGPISEGAADPRQSGQARPQDSMTWQWYVGTVDPVKKTRESMVFFIAMEPRKMLTIMDSLIDEFTPGQANQSNELKLSQVAALHEVVRTMERDRRAVVLGRKLLSNLNKRVGDRFVVTGQGLSQGLDLECEIVGVFPPGRYDMSAIMNRDYLNGAIEGYSKTHGGQKHGTADRSLNLMWLQVADMASFSQISEQMETSGRFVSPPIKCETLSSGVSTWIEGYQDMIWAMRWLLAPAILGTMILIVANAISISVRERRSEMAVLKVLGYRPVQILAMVLFESALVGGLGGMFSVSYTYLVVNHLVPHTQEFQIWVPTQALWLGPLIGIVAALAGSFLPAWNACRVRVAEIFARTA